MYREMKSEYLRAKRIVPRVRVKITREGIYGVSAGRWLPPNLNSTDYSSLEMQILGWNLAGENRRGEGR